MVETLANLIKQAGHELPSVPAGRARLATPGYEASGGGWRVRGYNPSNAGVNSLIEGGGESLVAWSRDLVRKNAWAANALETFTNNVIGSGIKPQPMHPDQKRRKELAEWFKRWTDDADANGHNDFYGLQALACRSMREGGECLVRLRFRRPEDGLVVPLQLQVLEAEHLPRNLNQDLPNGNVIRAGIEFNKIARREAYHVYRERPNERILFGASGETVRVPAESLLHLFETLRPGQHRGQPWLTPILTKLWELDQYDDAELVRKKVAAMITYLFEEELPEDGQRVANTEGQDPAEDGVAVGSIEPGSSVVIPPGITAKPSSAADLTGQYEAFYRVNLRSIARGLGLTYYLVSGDMTDVNYSSARIDLLDVRRRFERFQHQVIVFQLCRPVWSAFLEACVMGGLISAKDLENHREDYMAVEWRPPRWDWVDPEGDIRAELMMQGALLKARSATINELGYDEEEVDEQIRRDQEREEALGLKRRDAKASAQDAAPEPKSAPVKAPATARTLAEVIQ